MGYISRVKLFADGGCRGNPGPGAVGALVFDENDDELGRDSEVIGHTTNNRAEYHSIIFGLNLCAKYTRGRVDVYTDSLIVVNQMNKVWRLKSDELRKLFKEVKGEEVVFNDQVPKVVEKRFPPDRRLRRQAAEGIASSSGVRFSFQRL